MGEPLTPRTEAGKLLVRQITHGVATRWMDEHVVAIEQEAADAARAAAPGLDVERLREAARRAHLPDDVTVADIERLAEEYDRD